MRGGDRHGREQNYFALRVKREQNQPDDGYMVVHS